MHLDEKGKCDLSLQPQLITSSAAPRVKQQAAPYCLCVKQIVSTIKNEVFLSRIVSSLLLSLIANTFRLMTHVNWVHMNSTSATKRDDPFSACLWPHSWKGTSGVSQGKSIKEMYFSSFLSYLSSKMCHVVPPV